MKAELLTAEEMGEAEKAAIARGNSELTLMERAGQGVVDVILNKFSPCQTVVVCGPGKNGGDGKVVARLLKEKGWPVQVIATEDLSTHENLEHILSEVNQSVNQAELIVDALFGTGLSRPIEGYARMLVDVINASLKPVVSIDIPSGIDTNSGNCWGNAVHATLTVTFVRARPGHYFLPGRLYTGKLFVKDIGISDDLLPLVQFCVNHPSLWSLKEPQPTDHKFTRGGCLVLGNGSMPGAVKLASLAARRVGAGIVRLACKSEEYPIFASTVLGDIIVPIVSAQEFLELVQDDKYKALLWGTGALAKESTSEQALLLLSLKKPCVLDGGALSSFEGKVHSLTSVLHENVILTPHEGEFIRLFPHLAFIRNKAEKALKAAIESGAVVVLKGYDTVVASPQGKVVINANAPATLATAGTGDVLAGLMTGLLAQGLPPFQAAAAAVWIHGEAANRKGLGLIAEDLLGEIPSVLQFIHALHL
ncbi:MAG: NAD(P)H-hydrate dehydratase [Alphaproteobacteria bacterium]|nr:NAD(P)H-hydrate dehydratase [Alphaproteobacteria bacterium]